MKRLDQAAEDSVALAKRARHKTFQWARIRNGFFKNPDFRVAAEIAGLPLHQVHAIAGGLWCLANEAEPRGYVGDFRAATFGQAHGMPAEEAAIIFAALEHADVGWIDQDFLPSFLVANPDQEDATAPARDQRRKARRAIEKELGRRLERGHISGEQREGVCALIYALQDDALFALQKKLRAGVALEAALSTGHAATVGHGVADRGSVAATPRAEQTRTEKLAVDNSGAASSGEERGPSEDGVSGQGGDPQEAARLWIDTEGLKLLVERMEWPLTRAAMVMARWLDQNIGGDAIALMTILKTEEARGYIGPRFHTNVTDAIERHMRVAAQSTAQPSLPLGGIRRVKSA